MSILSKIDHAEVISVSLLRASQHLGIVRRVRDSRALAWSLHVATGMMPRGRWGSNPMMGQCPYPMMGGGWYNGGLLFTLVIEGVAGARRLAQRDSSEDLSASLAHMELASALTCICYRSASRIPKLVRAHISDRLRLAGFPMRRQSSSIGIITPNAGGRAAHSRPSLLRLTISDGRGISATTTVEFFASA